MLILLSGNGRVDQTLALLSHFHCAFLWRSGSSVPMAGYNRHARMVYKRFLHRRAQFTGN